MSKTAELTYAAVQSLAAELPELVGAEGPQEWPQVAQRLAELDAAWAAADESRRVGLAAAYRTTLAPYPAARQRLAAALGALSLSQSVLAGAAALAEQLGDDAGATALRDAAGDEAQPRYIGRLKVGQEAQSVKLGNVSFTFANVAAAVGSLLTSIAALTASDTSPIAVAGAVALLIATLASSLNRRIEVDDASVFLGLTEAAGPGGEAPLADIVDATNAARNAGRLRLGVLTEEAVLRSLSVLAQMGSVAPAEGEGECWRTVERHGLA